MIIQVISSLGHRFSIVDLGNITYFLGVKLLRKPDYLILSQTFYILDILRDEKMLDCNAVKT